MDLEEVWRFREEVVYPQFFGGQQRGIFVLTGELFTKRFGRREYDPRWLAHGVIEFGPTEERPFWLYVTSAYSNPWEQTPEDYDPTGPSGSGVEFLFATTEQAGWAIAYLSNMLAFDILLSVGHFEGRGPFEEFDTIPLRSPINGKEPCLIRNAIVSRPESLPMEFVLPSGRVEFLTFTGVTDNEIAFAKENSSEALIDRLRAAGFYPVTDPRRSSIL
jgi:hypothetical protein